MGSCFLSGGASAAEDPGGLGRRGGVDRGERRLVDDLAEVLDHHLHLDAERERPVGVNPQVLKNAEALIPIGRGGTPAEAAGAVYMFCIPESNYVSGQVLVCGGGRP